MPFITQTVPVSGFAAWSSQQAGSMTPGFTPMTFQRTMSQSVKGASFGITRDLFNGIEDAIRYQEGISHRVPRAMDTLVRFMALTNLGYAQAKSAGPRDRTQRRPDLAWKIPVRRITERYFYGWKVRRLGHGIWMLYNDSREAFFIEFGISNVAGTNRRVRRPIRKLTQRQTLEAMMRTKAYHRIWSEIYVDKTARRNRRGHGFSQTVQSPAMGSFSGPALGRRLP